MQRKVTIQETSGAADWGEDVFTEPVASSLLNRACAAALGILLATLPGEAVAQDPPPRTRFSGELSADRLLEFIGREKIGSLEELLERMHPETKRRISVAFKSESIDRNTVTPEAPRILIFSADGSFTMAFNGTAAGGAQRLEMIQY